MYFIALFPPIWLKIYKGMRAVNLHDYLIAWSIKLLSQVD